MFPFRLYQQLQAKCVTVSTFRFMRDYWRILWLDINSLYKTKMDVDRNF